VGTSIKNKIALERPQDFEISRVPDANGPAKPVPALKSLIK
jgi:hypothetical protein